MNTEDRKNSRIQRKKQEKMVALIVAGFFFLCTVLIISIKYNKDPFSLKNKNEKIATRGDAKDKSEEAAKTEDTEEEQTEITTEPETDTHILPEDNSEDISESTRETVTEEDNSVGGDSESDAAFLQYVTTTNVDASFKRADYFNTKIFQAGNVVDDEYFSTVAMIGDSRTMGLGMFSGLNNLDVYAATGMNIGQVLSDKVISRGGTSMTVLQAMAGKTYENIYISFGINELGWALTDVFISDYKAVIDALRENYPEAIIYVENVLPVTKRLSDSSSIYTNDRVDEFNGLLKEMCMEYGDVIYLDVASSVRKNGVLPAEASTDGSHCNEEYCLKWLNYIRKNVYVKK